MSALSELGQLLETLGIATQGDDLFLGSRPDKPDRCLTLYQYPGMGPEYVQTGLTVEKPQIQVVARAQEYEEAEALAYQAWVALDNVRNTTLSGTKYRSVTPNASPATMGRDTNDRLLVFFNATVEKEVSVGVPS